MKKNYNFIFGRIFVSVVIMLMVHAANCLQVAVLGSGMTGATTARTLAEEGIHVTVFEAGSSIGGRMSTRITEDKYQFDHGAQYISAPKSETFRNAIIEWEKNGWIKDWIGKFYTVDDTGELVLEMKKERWVGYPTMNSICCGLLDHKNIRVQFHTRAHARFRKARMWDLFNEESNSILGSFDWVIITDRMSGDLARKDLSSANVEEFRSDIRSIQSIKSLASMVVFRRTLGLDMDAIQFNRENSGVLGWAARDTSKPGREREDGRECWVLQSHPYAANDILQGMSDLEAIREKAKTVMVRDFLDTIPILSKKSEIVDTPEIIASFGHRWGAAFPIPSDDFSTSDSIVYSDKNFIACGDYFGKFAGRVEAAYLSGISAAHKLCYREKLMIK
jgi:hypothetical protein